MSPWAWLEEHVLRRPGPERPDAPGRARLTGPSHGRYLVSSSVATTHRGTWDREWREAADGCGLARRVVVPAGVTVSAPRLGHVTARPDGVRLHVQMAPGQMVRDYREAATTLAVALRVGRVVVTELGGRWLALDLLAADPLAGAYPLAQDGPDGLLGVAEHGGDVTIPWSVRTHTVVQGQTGSGKSTGLYGMLAPLAARPDVQVGGLDPSGVLWRPWTGLRGDAWRVSGLSGGLDEHRAALTAWCAELDRRLAMLPEDTDSLPTDQRTPLLVLVFEEVAGLYRAADLVDRKVGAEVRARVGRLLAEGRKVGVRVVLVVQRADAAIIDGSSRAQCATRLSYAADADALRMLHPAGTVDPDEHTAAAPGVAVLTAPVLGTLRLRSGDCPYPEYARRVRAAPRPASAA